MTRGYKDLHLILEGQVVPSQFLNFAGFVKMTLFQENWHNK